MNMKFRCTFMVPSKTILSNIFRFVLNFNKRGNLGNSTKQKCVCVYKHHQLG